MNLKLYANKVYRKESVGSIQIIDNMLSKNVIYQLVMQVHVYCQLSSEQSCVAKAAILREPIIWVSRSREPELPPTLMIGKRKAVILVDLHIIMPRLLVRER